jgi:hypothetical protein
MYQFMAVIIATAFISSAVTLTIATDGPTGFGTVIEPGSMVEDASYIIFKDGSTYYAKNGTTGSIDYVSLNATSVFQDAIDSIYSDPDGGGGLIFVKSGIYYTNCPILIAKGHISLRGEGQFATILNYSGTNYAIIIDGNTSYIQSTIISDLRIECNSVGGGIYMPGNAPCVVTGSLIENICLYQVTMGIWINGGETYMNEFDNIRIIWQVGATGSGIWDGGGLYNSFHNIGIFITDGWAISSYGGRSTWDTVQLDGPIRIGGDSCRMEHVTIEGLYSYSVNEANSIISVTENKHSLSDINIVNCPTSKASRGMTVYGDDIAIRGFHVWGPDYPVFPLQLYAGSSGIAEGIDCPVAMSWLSAAATSGWAFIGGDCQNSGISVQDGDAITQDFTIPHGLTWTPNRVLASIGNATIPAIDWIEATTTNLVVHLNSSAPSGIDNVVIYWWCSM